MPTGAIVILGVSCLLLAAALDWIPRRPHRGIFFGVTTGPDFPCSAEGSRIAAGYRRWVWAGFAVALLLMATARLGLFAPVLAVAPILTLIAFTTVGWVGAWRAASAYPAPPAPGGALLAGGPGLGLGSLAAIVLSFAILLAAFVFLTWHWDSLPDRIPVHYGASGQPDRWGAKSVFTVFGPLVFAIFFEIVLLVTVFSLAFRSRRLASAEDAPLLLHRQRVQLALILAMMISLALLFAAIAIRPVLPGAFGTLFWLFLSLPMLLAAGLIWWQWKLSKLPGPSGDDTPDACWKWGLFYHNPDDPALMVEKRTGLGYTLNFGHPLAWVLLAVLLALMLLPLLMGLASGRG